MSERNHAGLDAACNFMKVVSAEVVSVIGIIDGMTTNARVSRFTVPSCIILLL